MRSYGWLTRDAAPPHEAVIAFPGGKVVEFSRLVLHNRGKDNWQNRAKDIEIWVSSESKDAGFRKVALFRLQPWNEWQTLKLPPTRARFLKVRVMSNYGGQYFMLGEVMVFEE
jgi:hypothetical protein